MDATHDLTPLPADPRPPRGGIRAELTEQLFRQYVARLKALVRARLNERYRNAAGGTSDVVQNILVSFLAGNPDWEDPDGVWPLLVTITTRRVSDTAKWFRRGKRDIRRTVPGIVEMPEGGVAPLWDLPRLAAPPTAEAAAMLVELVESLPERLQEVLRWKLQGYTHQEIGQRLGDERSEKVVGRRVAELRDWLVKLLRPDGAAAEGEGEARPR